MKTVLIPKENEKDLSEIPPKVKEGLTLVPVSRIEDAMPYVFSSSRGKSRKKR